MKALIEKTATAFSVTILVFVGLIAFINASSGATSMPWGWFFLEVVAFYVAAEIGLYGLGRWG